MDKIKKTINRLIITEEIKIRGNSDLWLKIFEKKSAESFWKGALQIKKVNDNEVEIRPTFSLIGSIVDDIKINVELNEPQRKLVMKSNTLNNVKIPIGLSILVLIISFLVGEQIPKWVYGLIIILPIWFFVIFRIQEQILLKKIKKTLKDNNLIEMI